MRLILTLTCLLLLSACGFEPVYGSKSGAMRSEFSAIEISVIPDRSGQVVRNHLIDRLHQRGADANPQYRLDISPIRESIVEIGFDRDDEASRAQMREETTLNLIDTQTGKAVLTRTVRTTTGYNILEGQFTTFVSRRDARDQALRALSERIVTQLEIHFTQ